MPPRNNYRPLNSWAPAYYTPRISKISDGEDVAAFAQEWLTVTKGVRAGEPLTFLPWQRWLIDGLLERRPIDHKLRYRRALVGVPRKQGKSLIGSAIALYGLFSGLEPGAEVYSAAGDRQQARIVFGEAKAQVEANPLLATETKIYRDAIEVPAYGAVYRVLSSDGRLQHGLNPSMVIFDELWGQKNDDLWDALTLGSGARVDPIIIAITTAGFDVQSLCGRIYQYGQRVASGDLVDPAFGFYWWEAPQDCRITDKKAWKIANPNLKPGLLDIEDMEASTKQSSELSFRRFRLNQWVRAQESWLPMGVWDANGGICELNKDAPVWVGIDMALRHDSIGVVAVQEQEGVWVMIPKVWYPKDGPLDVAAVEEYLRHLHLNYDVKEFAYDPAFFQRSAEALVDDGLPMLEFPQSAARMVPACGLTYDLIVNNKVKHPKDPVFTDQVLSAAQRATENGWRLSKGKSKRKIDACIAMVMALDVATRRPTKTPSPMIESVWT